MQSNITQMADIKNIHSSPGRQNSRRSIDHPGYMSERQDTSTLHLTHILQSTLELDKLLELFDDEASAIVAHDGLSYENNKISTYIEIGEHGKHRCSYNLILLGENLGEITLYRNRRFTKSEIEKIENLVAALIYPLRNTLLYKQAVEKAFNDPLTGLNNRAALDNALNQEINLAQRHKQDLSILMIDLDKFKSINDTYGHITGDAVLKKVADRMSDCMRSSDIVFRYGGEEFSILLRNTDSTGANLLAERVRQGVEKLECRYDDLIIPVTVSIGAATLSESDNAETFVQRADEALYSAKENGRNCVVNVDSEKYNKN